MTCEECGDTFPTARALAAHAKKHVPGKECPLCGKKVKYLGSHRRREHADDPLVQLENGLAALTAEVRALREQKREWEAKNPPTPGD